MMVTGTKYYNFGSPLFQSVTVSLGSDDNIYSTTSTKKLHIKTRNNSKTNVYVHGIYWNSVLVNNTIAIDYDLLMQGKLLQSEYRKL